MLMSEKTIKWNDRVIYLVRFSKASESHGFTHCHT